MGGVDTSGGGVGTTTRRPPPGARPPAQLCVYHTETAVSVPHRDSCVCATQRQLAGWLAGRGGRIFGFFFFQNSLKWAPGALGGPGGYFPPIFALFLGPWGALGAPPGGPWGGPGPPPLLLPIFLKADALWGAPPVQFTLVI